MFRDFASLSDITPLEVESIAIPKPLRTLGISVEPEYIRKPGLLTLSNFSIAFFLLTGLYFKAILIVSCGLSFFSTLSWFLVL